MKADSVPSVASPGITLPGGNETFPVLGIGGDASPAAIYPELDRLGPIGYKDIPGEFLVLMRSIAEGLRDKKVDPELCNPARPFIAPLASFQLEKLPEPSDVFFSRPAASEDGQSGILFRLKYLSGTVPSFVYATVKTVKVDGKLKINEVFFEGTADAGLAQPN